MKYKTLRIGLNLDYNNSYGDASRYILNTLQWSCTDILLQFQYTFLHWWSETINKKTHWKMETSDVKISMG